MKDEFLKRVAFDYFVKGLDFWRRDILDRLDKIERRFKAYLNCPFCGFDQGRANVMFGTEIPKGILRKFNLTGTAGAKTATETAMEQHQEQYDLYNWLNGKTDKKPEMANKILTKLMKDDIREQQDRTCADILKRAGECICPQVTLYPRGGMTNEPSSIDVNCPIHGLPKPTPDLPLNVRVAKALGEDVMMKDGDWFTKVIINDLREFPGGSIPDYPNDLVAVVKAGKIIAKKYDVDIWIRIKDGLFLVNIQKEHTVLCSAESECLPEAMSLVIVKHAEGK